MKKTFGLIAVVAVLIAVIGYWGFEWIFCRFYVPAGYMAVITAKNGKMPSPGTLLVERGERGIWREVLGEGRHFLNPVYYEVKIIKATSIPLGKVGIVTSKTGKELPPGEFIAPDRNSKGVWKEVLGPGVYRLNPEGYSIDIVDAVSIPAGYVGVITSQAGVAPAPGKFAVLGEKGVLRDVLQPGLYYINRYVNQINVIEIGMNQVTMSGSGNTSIMQGRNRLRNYNSAIRVLEDNTLSFQQELRKEVQSRQPKATRILSKPLVKSEKKSGKMVFARASAPKQDEAVAIFGVSRAVEFPSRDGFKISLDMTVEFELLPEHIAKIYLLYGDLPQVVEKIILPQVLSVSRLKGSSYRAQDFIMGDGREKFQLDLRRELEKTLAAKNIVVHNAIIRNVEIPKDILSPIQAVSLAREQNLTNVSMQNTAKKLAELNTETELIEQRRREVGQETDKIVAQITAEAKKEVASIQATGMLKVAELQLKRSEIMAQSSRLRGEMEVKTKFMLDNERAKGELLKAEAIGKIWMPYLTMVEALNPKVTTKIIYAGDGTLWTDLKSATLPLPAYKQKQGK